MAIETGEDRSAIVTPPRRAGRWKIVALGVAILLCGIVIGAGLTLHLLRSNLLSLIQEPDRLPGIVAGRVDHALKLDDAQRAAVDRILEERWHALEALRRENRPQVKAEFDAIRDEVAAVLTPEQAEKWVDRFDALRERWSPGSLELE